MVIWSHGQVSSNLEPPTPKILWWMMHVADKNQLLLAIESYYIITVCVYMHRKQYIYMCICQSTRHRKHFWTWQSRWRGPPQKVRTKSVKKIKIGQTGIDGAAWGVAPSIYARGLAKYANGASEFQFILWYHHAPSFFPPSVNKWTPMVRCAVCPPTYTGKVRQLSACLHSWIQTRTVAPSSSECFKSRFWREFTVRNLFFEHFFFDKKNGEKKIKMYCHRLEMTHWMF